MNIKKILAGVTACVVALSLIGCGTETESDSEPSHTPESSSSSVISSIEEATSTKPVEKPITSTSTEPAQKPTTPNDAKKELPDDAIQDTFVSDITGSIGSRTFTTKLTYDDMWALAEYEEGESGDAVLSEMIIQPGSYTLSSIAKQIDNSDGSAYKQEGDTFVRTDINQSQNLQFDAVYNIMVLAAISSQYENIEAFNTAGYITGPNGEKVYPTPSGGDIDINQTWPPKTDYTESTNDDPGFIINWDEIGKD